MFGIIVGIIVGVWLGQTFTLPNVQETVSRWMASAPVQDKTAEQEESTTPAPPVFTGEMPVD